MPIAKTSIRVNVSCPQCGKSFLAFPSRISRARPGLLCCSRQCSSLFRTGKPTAKRQGHEVACAHCGKTFLQRPSKLARQDSHYCSEECYHAARWGGKRTHTVACVYCGVEFERIQVRIDRAKHGPFCSKECAGKWKSQNLIDDKSPAWKGGDSDWYMGGWRAVRKAARERYNNTCCDCGATAQETGRTMDVHHIRPYEDYENPSDAHSLDNLVTLCRRCHAKRHTPSA